MCEKGGEVTFARSCCHRVQTDYLLVSFNWQRALNKDGDTTLLEGLGFT